MRNLLSSRWAAVPAVAAGLALLSFVYWLLTGVGILKTAADVGIWLFAIAATPWFALVVFFSLMVMMGIGIFKVREAAKQGELANREELAEMERKLSVCEEKLATEKRLRHEDLAPFGRAISIINRLNAMRSAATEIARLEGLVVEQREIIDGMWNEATQYVPAHPFFHNKPDAVMRSLRTMDWHSIGHQPALPEIANPLPDHAEQLPVDAPGGGLWAVDAVLEDAFFRQINADVDALSDFLERQSAFLEQQLKEEWKCLGSLETYQPA